MRVAPLGAYFADDLASCIEGARLQAEITHTHVEGVAGALKIEQTQAIPLSVTHYMDRGGNVLADISPRRYFCNQCHVAQMGVKPLIANTFRDVDTVMKDAAAKAAAKKK